MYIMSYVHKICIISIFIYNYKYLFIIYIYIWGEGVTEHKRGQLGEGMGFLLVFVSVLMLCENWA